MTVVAKGRTAPMSPEEYDGWREALIRLDDAVVLTEQATHAAPKAEQAFVRGKLKAYTKARDAVLTVVRREQEKRQDAAVSDSEARDATFGGEHDSD